MQKFIGVILLLFIFGCAGKHIEKKKMNVADTSTIKTSDTVKQYVLDSLEQLYMDGKVFYSTFVRLREGKDEFIFTDSSYFGMDLLDSSNREDYYRRVRNLIPKDELQVHQMIWDLPEMKIDGAEGTGGYHGVVTWIQSRPTADDPYYEVAIKRDYYDRLGAYTPLSFVRVRLKPREILVMPISSGENLPIEKWRKLPNDEK